MNSSASAPAIQRPSVQDRSLLNETRKRVLVVDDDAGVLSAITRLLDTLDVDVEACSDPVRAMQLFRDGSFDLVISDERMPKMSGIEMLTKVRANSPRTPTILLTAYRDPSAWEHAYERCGVFRYLCKPWDNMDLVATVREALRAGSSL